MSQWTQTVVLDGSRVNLNGALRGALNTTMLQVLGNPRGDYSQRCQPVTNERLRSLIVTEDVGPFQATGLRPAVRTAIYALLDEPLLDAFGFPRPSRALRAGVRGSLKLRARLLRWLPRRRRPLLRTEMRHRTYPAGYRIEDLGPPQAAARSGGAAPRQTPP